MGTTLRDSSGSLGTQAEPSRFVIGIDTGGTFTDCYVSGADGAVLAKADTTPHDLASGVLASIERAAEALGLDRSGLLRRTDTVRLSTTIGTNTFINRDGARIGLLVGEDLAARLDGLAPGVPLARDLIATIPEDVRPDVVERVRLATRALLDHGARILVIALSGDARLPEREARVRAIVAEDYPRHYLGAVPVLPSHQVTPIAEGIIRTQSALMDAYIHPVMSRFLYRVEDQLRSGGYARPLQIGNANGGTSCVAKTAALRSWGSGPAGGVAAAAAMARHLGVRIAVAVDVGGTSSDICVIADGAWDYEVQPIIDGIAVSLPTLGMRSVGVATNSILRVVEGRITVGPDSAGAQPGPASFGLGGRAATITDAACCLGYFDPAHFLGGRRTLDIEAARRAMAEVARPLGLSAEVAAARAMDQAAALIAAAIERQLALRGIRAGACALFATGGGGGLLGHAVGARLGAQAVYAFPVSPVFSAFGVSQFDIQHTYETLPSAEAIRPRLDGLKAAALADMRSERVDPADIVLRYEAELADGDGLRVEDFGTDVSRIDAAVGAHGDRLRLIRLIARAPRPPRPLTRIYAAAANKDAGGRRDIFDAAGRRAAPLYDWTTLPHGTAIEGPAVLETGETTLVLPRGARAAIGGLGEVRIDAPSASNAREASAVAAAAGGRS